MQFIVTVLPFIQATLSILLIVAVLLQVRGSSVGGAFGGGDADTTFYTRRGGEKALFVVTIVLGVAFALSAFVALFIHQ
ncbi:MAG: preprotein translocase subunit SecG [Candidatus Pacebacteria bacterium]|nr:preprotein translocase subunit SecG [Candidatus Paceibacterota bacterium]